MTIEASPECERNGGSAATYPWRRQLVLAALCALACWLPACVTFFDTDLPDFADTTDASVGDADDSGLDDAEQGDARTDAAVDGGAEDVGEDSADALADADIVEEPTCETLDCPSDGRVCIDDGQTAECGPCLDGFVERDGTCEALLTCDDLECMADNRTCIDATETDDASCGECLTGFIEDESSDDPDAACIDDPTFCEDRTECPDDIVGDWSVCDFDAECDTEGEQERMVTTFRCIDNACVSSQAEESGECTRVIEDETPCAGGTGVCVDEVCVGPPTSAPLLLATGTDGGVELSWTLVSGADSYELYRDGELLETVVGLTYFDASTMVLGGPEAPVVSATEGSVSTGVRLSWDPVFEGVPVTHRYEVLAVNASGAGPASDPRDASADAVEVASYEVQIEDNPFFDVGAVTSYLDSTAPVGELEAGEVSFVTSSMTTVTMELAGAGLGDGDPVTYRVRGVTSGGPRGPESSAISGRRGSDSASLDITWERSDTRVLESFLRSLA